MRLLSPLLVLLSPAVISARSTTTDDAAPALSTSTLTLWPLNKPAPIPWLKVIYNPLTLTTISTTTLLDPTSIIPNPSSPNEASDSSENLLRVGLAPSEKHSAASTPWRSGVLATTEAFLKSDEFEKIVTLHLDGKGPEAYGVGFRTWRPTAAGTGQGGVRVEVSQMKSGPSPHLNKPVVLSPDGKGPVVEEEKTFFQK
ncbi:MAG: hypothetical protein M4579_003508 [Chaenotheca gracillima]|nr:MAG: hypothetical protein M4579_003508 [Chaenotheca gracillima]